MYKFKKNTSSLMLVVYCLLSFSATAEINCSGLSEEIDMAEVVNAGLSPSIGRTEGHRCRLYKSRYPEKATWEDPVYKNKSKPSIT